MALALPKGTSRPGKELGPKGTRSNLHSSSASWATTDRITRPDRGKENAGSIEIITRLLGTIGQVFQLLAKHQDRIELYLQREDWANDVEYQRLLQNHPFPLVGLSLQD